MALRQEQSGFPGRPNSQRVLGREVMERLGSGSLGRRSKSVTHLQHVGFPPTSSNSLAAVRCQLKSDTIDPEMASHPTG